MSHIPVLSVVIPAYNVEAYLGECLDSLLAQVFTDLEVIVVDDGSTDGTRSVASAFARQDPRITVLHQSNSGQGIARNVGVEHARGDFLAFIDADDTVPPRAFDHMVNTLRQTGSDFCVGSARRMANGRFRPTVWDQSVHTSDRFATTIAEFPLAMQDIIACNRMFRTEFWREKVGGFRGRRAYEDHVPMLTAYVRARRFDILSTVTYNWRIREDLSSTSQQKASIDNLLDRISVKEEANQLLLEEASPTVYNMWVARALDIDFPPFIESALAGSEMYRGILATTCRTFLGRATPEALADVRVSQKARAWLAAEERWEDLHRAQEYFLSMRKLPTTQVEDGAIVAEHQVFLRGAPHRIRELSPVESRFDGVVDHVTPLDDGRIEISGWALVRGLDMPDPSGLEAWLVGTDSVRHIPLAVETYADPQATIWARDRSARYDGGGFRVTVDLSGVPQGQWQLRIEIEQRGVARAGALHHVVAGGSAARLITTLAVHAGLNHQVSATKDSEHGFVLNVAPAPAVLHDATTDGDGPASGTIETPADEPLQRLVLAGGGGQHEVPVEEITASRPQVRAWTFSCPWPTGNADRSLLADLGPGDAVRVLMTRPPARDVDAEWTWTAGARAGAWLAASPTPPRVTSLHRDRDSLVVDIHAVDVSALENLRLENPSTMVPACDIETLGAHAFRATFSLRSRSFGGPEMPLPTGDLTLRAGRGIEPKAETTLLTKMPTRVRCAELRLTIASPPRGAVVVTVTAPLDAHEVSFAGQYALQRAYQESDAALSESVLFQCYRGEFATDSQAALDEGLRTARPELTRYWGVSDFSVQVPVGSVPLLIGSREWYDALATSRFLCNNIDFDPFFRKRPGQRYLQTFHGYPFKSMGRGFWRGKGHSEERISREQARRNEEYDAILVPSERAAEFYRSEYAFTGNIMVTGYPRGDVLLNADRDRERTRVLDRLGVDAGQKVVLYAPTYRDHLTTRVYAAKRFDELDLTALTRSLGPDYTVLVRGHNNNQREADRTHDVAQVLDVTDYPEINDLTIAADAAILDYSSLRFDWALTGKPMVFFVPDLDTYFAQRPPLFPFDESAPGPLLTSTDEVAHKLLDLPGLLAGQQADIAAFNAEFNQLHDGHATERVIEAFFSD